MDDLPDKAEAYRTTTSYLPDAERESCPSCGTPWIWIILFIAALLAIIGMVVWVIWLYHKNSTSKGQTIELIDPNIQVDSDTQITGTFTTKNANDIVTLYATLHPPKFNASGGLDNASAAKNQVGKGSDKSVSLSGLSQGVKYYATLIVTNTKSSNYKSYTQIVYMQGSTITPTIAGSTGTNGANTFEIQDILQVGAIQVNDPINNGIYPVIFNQRPSTARSLFVLNSSSQLQLENNTLTDVCLFNSAGNLVAADCKLNGVTGLTANDGQWVYNPTPYANRICLKSTIPTSSSSTAPTCIKLSGVGNGTGTLTVANDSGNGDAFALAFETAQ